MATNPRAYFDGLSEAEQDRIFTQAGARAIRDGADMSQVVNARRGMFTAGRRRLTRESITRFGVARPGRLMPEQIYTQAGTRDEAITLLRQHGYLRAAPARSARSTLVPPQPAAATAAPSPRIGTPTLPIPRAPVPADIGRRFDDAVAGIDAFHVSPHVSGVLTRAARDRTARLRVGDRFRIERAVADYTGRDSAYVGINGALRRAGGGRLGDDVAAEIRQQVDDLDRMLGPLPSDMVLYRGIQNPRAAVPGWGDDVVGLEWTAHGYQSTSALVDVAETFARGEVAGAGAVTQPTVMRILVPKGTPGVQLSPAAAEVLLARGVRYRIVADHGISGGVRRVDVEIVPPRRATAPAAEPAAATRPAPQLPAAQRMIDATDDDLAALPRRVYEGTFAGIRTSVTEARRLDERTVAVRGELRNPAGEKVGEFSRVVMRTDDGSTVAYHDALELDPRIQGQGFAQAFNGHLERWYRSSGVDRVELYANIDIGGYAWARAGYSFAHQRAAERVLHRLRRTVEGRELDIRGTPIPPADLAAAQELLDRADRLPFGADGYPTAYEVSQLGRPAGAGRDDMWLGKRTLLGSNWDAVKPL